MKIADFLADCAADAWLNEKAELAGSWSNISAHLYYHQESAKRRFSLALSRYQGDAAFRSRCDAAEAGVLPMRAGRAFRCQVL